MSRSRHNTTYKSSSVIRLLERICWSRVQQERNKFFGHLIFQCLFLLFTFSILSFSRCPDRIYNAWNGPFHLNLSEFITHWNIYSGNASTNSWFLTGLSSLDREYLQVELGEDKIDTNEKNLLRIYYRHPHYGKTLYTFHLINESKISTFPMRLFIKLPTDLQSHFHERLPYRFELFSADTLKCIAQQIDISPVVYQVNFESFMHIQLIEEIYDRNATDFNRKVIIKCGILIGYLYDCATERVHTWYSNQPYIFAFSAAAFDASSSYSPYMSYFFGILLLLWCIERIFRIFTSLFDFVRFMFHRVKPMLCYNIQTTLTKFEIDSIEILDYLLMRTSDEDNHRNQLFLIQEQYLIIFEINLNERNLDILCHFYTKTPFIIIDINGVIEINSDYILVSNGFHRNKISLPKMGRYSGHSSAEWLHERLMDCCVNYRHRYNQQQWRRQEEERRHRLATYIDEEENEQRVLHANDIERIWNCVTSASPRFIAQFRLQDAHIVNTQLPETTCVVCYEPLKLGEYYSQWPCAARHTFHHLCMLKTLRNQNQCPLCRHLVEAADVPPPINVLYNMLLAGQGFS